jgi:hypothetical protein
MVFKIEKARAENMEEIGELFVYLHISAMLFSCCSFSRTALPVMHLSWLVSLEGFGDLSSEVKLTMRRLLSASTAPQIMLEFGKCKRED